MEHQEFLRYQLNYTTVFPSTESENFNTIFKVIAFILSKDIRSYLLQKVALVDGREVFFSVNIAVKLTKIYAQLHSDNDITIY